VHRLRVLGIFLTVALAAPGTASAAEKGVTIDPGSPSAKEYALPLETARRDANGEQHRPVRPGDRDSEPFGVGISPDSPSKRGGAGGVSEADANADADRNHGDGTSRPRSSIDRASASRIDDQDAGIGSSTAMLGGGAGILVLVGVGAAALRTLRRS